MGAASRFTFSIVTGAFDVETGASRWLEQPRNANPSIKPHSARAIGRGRSNLVFFVKGRGIFRGRQSRQAVCVSWATAQQRIKEALLEFIFLELILQRGFAELLVSHGVEVHGVAHIANVHE